MFVAKDSMVLSEELKQFWENAKKEMRQLYENVKKHPLTCLICITVVVTAVILLTVLAYWRVNQFGITYPKDLADAENNYRATLAQILGGAAVGIGIYFAWGNLTTAREGQITERFTRAVDQLGEIDQSGNPAIEIRLGGIYALERIANESEKDYWPIMEILTAYIRKNSNYKASGNKETSKNNILEVNEMSLDIQAVLTVIGIRKYYFGAGESKRLNLSETCLQGAHLIEYHLERANLDKANLKNAILSKTHLEQATFIGAHLEDAHLGSTYLENAVFIDSYLENTDFYRAHLEYALFIKTHVECTIFRGAYLENAYFEETSLAEANLAYANLKGAQGLTIDQLSKVKTLYEAKLDDELLIPLKEKYPDLFEEPKVEP